MTFFVCFANNAKFFAKSYNDLLTFASKKVQLEFKLTNLTDAQLNREESSVSIKKDKNCWL
jgi:hypothetical protein